MNLAWVVEISTVGDFRSFVESARNTKRKKGLRFSPKQFTLAILILFEKQPWCVPIVVLGA